MARHRDVRTMNYSDEYDGYDDVYGHSADDDYCISPSVEQFMFDRNKQANISSYFTEPDIEEDNEEVDDESVTPKSTEKSELDKAKLLSCAVAVKSVIGDTCSEAELNERIVALNYNTEAIINSILNDEASKCKKDKPKKGKSLVQAQSDSELKNLISCPKPHSFKPMTLKKDCKMSDKTEKFSSLSDMIYKTSKPPETTGSSSPSFSSLADLTAHHLKESGKKSSSPSGFTIPKMNFKNPILSSKTSDTKSTFDSLSDLTAHHLKISNNKKENTEQNSSISNFVIPKIGCKNINSDKTDGQSFSSLNDLAAQHLKIVNKTNDNSNVQVKVKTEKPDTFPTLNDGSLSQNSCVIIPKLAVQMKQEKLNDNENLKDISETILEDISKIKIKEEPNIDKDLDVSMEAPKLDSSITIKREKLENKQLHNPTDGILKEIKNECLLNIHKTNRGILKKAVSSFGKVLCKSYARKMPYKKTSYKKYLESNNSEMNCKNQIVRFDFSSPSPDAIILLRLKAKLTAQA